MGLKNLEHRYSTWVIGLHWLMLVLLVAVYASMELRGLAPKGGELRAFLKPLHYLLGLCVLALVAVRIGVRWNAGAAPGIRPPMPDWQARFAHLMHYALYAFMLAMPVLGWLALSAKGEPIVLWGLPVPALVGADEPLARQFKDVHEAVATLGYVLIGLHAAAALAHHYVVHDDTLVRMLPGHGSRQKFK